MEVKNMDYGIMTTILGVSLLVFSVIISIISTRKHRKLVDAYPVPTVVYDTETERDEGLGVIYRVGVLRRVLDSRMLHLEANLVFISLLNVVSLGSFLKPSITIPVIVTNLCLSFVSTVVTFMVPDLLDRVQKLVVKDNDDSLMFLKGAHETTPSGYAEVVLGGA